MEQKLTAEQKKTISDFLSYFYDPTLQLLSDMAHNLVSQYEDASANNCGDEATKIRDYQALIDTELGKTLVE